MTTPDDLPWLLQYKVGKTIRTCLPRRPVTFYGSAGATDASQVCPMIPLGAEGWRLKDDEEWRPLDEIPKNWLPYLKRVRGTELDPRKDNAPALAEALRRGLEQSGHASPERESRPADVPQSHAATDIPVECPF